MLVECLNKALGFAPPLYKLAMVVYTNNLSTLEA